MADIQIPAFIDLKAAIANVTKAQAAVHEGIATHAEKEVVKQHKKREELAKQNKLRDLGL